MRAVVDTNVWVSAVLNSAGLPAAILDALICGRFVLIASEPLLTELRQVLSRPRLARRYRIAPSDVDSLVDLLRARAEMVSPLGQIQVCRDPDDDVVIETAVVGSADAVVTRDDDLKGAPEVIAFLEEFGIPVWSVRQFLVEIVKNPA